MSRDYTINELEGKLGAQESDYRGNIEQLISQYEGRIQTLKHEKQSGIADLTQKLENEQENIKIYEGKLKQTNDYVQSAKRLLKLKSDDTLCKKCYI